MGSLLCNVFLSFCQNQSDRCIQNTLFSKLSKTHSKGLGYCLKVVLSLLYAHWWKLKVKFHFKYFKNLKKQEVTKPRERDFKQFLKTIVECNEDTKFHLCCLKHCTH